MTETSGTDALYAADLAARRRERLFLGVDLHFNLGLWHFARERYTPIETQCRGVSIGV